MIGRHERNLKVLVVEFEALKLMKLFDNLDSNIQESCIKFLGTRLTN